MARNLLLALALFAVLGCSPPVALEGVRRDAAPDLVWNFAGLCVPGSGRIGRGARMFLLVKLSGDLMNGKFVHGKDLEVQTFDWGTFRWVSGPSATGARQLVVCQVEVFPGKGHNFHQHLGQEEVIHIIDGGLEQWLGRERRVLGAGDSVFIPRGLVHASFTLGDRPARCLAILGPCLGDSGYELVDVSAQAPWSTLRAQA